LSRRRRSRRSPRPSGTGSWPSASRGSGTACGRRCRPCRTAAAAASSTSPRPSPPRARPACSTTSRRRARTAKAPAAPPGQRVHDRPDADRGRRLGLRVIAMDTPVPVIDLGPFLSGAAAEPPAVARAIARACEDIGFFTIVGHGVDAGLVRAMYDVSRAFFDLPLDDKQRVRRPTPEQSRGYIGVGEENLAYGVGTATTDLKEFFAIGPVDVPAEPYYTCAAAYPSFAPNVWPARPPDLRRIYTAYYRAME